VSGNNISNVSVNCVSKIWGTAVMIEPDNQGEAIAPKIAFDGKGNALAVWEQSDGNT
jgi:hypothetical protein